MLKTGRDFIFLILLIGSITCCTRSVDKNAAFIKLYQDIEMNTTLLLDEPIGDQNSGKIGDLYRLMLTNAGSGKVVFPNDFGVKIYRFQEVDHEWTQIRNSGEYVPPSNRFLSPKSADSPGISIVVIKPVIQDSQTPIDIRVVVQGWLEDDPDQLVGAYVDITLHP